MTSRESHNSIGHTGPESRSRGNANGYGRKSMKSPTAPQQWSLNAPRKAGPGPKPMGSSRVTAKNTTNLRKGK